MKMKKQIGLLSCMLIMPFVVLLSRNVFASSLIELNASDMLPIIQHSDLAGLATIISANPTNCTFEIDVKQWWLGSWQTNRFELCNADTGVPDFEDRSYINRLYGWHPSEKTGCDIVFFAVTNMYKVNSSPYPNPITYDWNYAQTFTNASDECPPRFMCEHGPSVFLLETNYDYYLNVLSNITYSIFITRDKMQLYRGLRDARGVDGNGEISYRSMAHFPLRSMMYHETFPEEDYITMLNDPLLLPVYRTNALHRLIDDYKWSRTNAVPEP